jgi:hypothetical protein
VSAASGTPGAAWSRSCAKSLCIARGVLACAAVEISPDATPSTTICRSANATREAGSIVSCGAA